jgi:hypothetical protein
VASSVFDSPDPADDAGRLFKGAHGKHSFVGLCGSPPSLYGN